MNIIPITPPLKTVDIITPLLANHQIYVEIYKLISKTVLVDNETALNTAINNNAKESIDLYL